MRCRKPSFTPQEIFAGTSSELSAPAENSRSEEMFLHFRQKVQESSLLSASTEKLLAELRFCGQITVVINNGNILKSSYGEGYFRKKPSRSVHLSAENSSRSTAS